MGQVKTTSSANFAVPARVVGPTCYTAAPVDYIADWSHPWRPAISTTNATGTPTRFYIDFGAATALVGAYFVTNLGSVLLQTSTDAASWSTNQTVTVSQAPDSKLYKAYSDLTSFNHRYLGIATNDSSPEDGSGVMKIGCLVGIKSWDDTWTQNPGYDYGRDIVSPVSEDVRFGDKIATGNQYASLSLSSSLMASSMSATLLRIGGYGATPFLFWRNNSDSSQAYIVRTVGDRIGYAEPGVNHLRFGPIVLREVC